jgi:hypothetical protein
MTRSPECEPRLLPPATSGDYQPAPPPSAHATSRRRVPLSRRRPVKKCGRRR